MADVSESVKDSPIGSGTHYPLPSQPHRGVAVCAFFNPFSCLPVQTVRSALGYENIEGDSVESCAEVGVMTSPTLWFVYRWLPLPV